MVTVGFRARVVALLLLAAEAAVGATAEAGRLETLGLTSGAGTLASLFAPFTLGEAGPCRAAPGLWVCIDVRLVSLLCVWAFSAGSDRVALFVVLATFAGLGAEPLVMGFSIMANGMGRGVLGEVGELTGNFVGGTCLGGGDLIGFATFVPLSSTEGGLCL